MATKKGTNRNDKITGGNGDDILYGLDGNDTLDGGKGDDDLMGGDGKDTFIGRYDGSDGMDGGRGVDTLTYAKSSGAISISIDKNIAAAIKGSDIDSIKNIENFIGSKGADSILGTTTGYVYGGKGSDQLSAYGGVVRGDEGLDYLYADPSRLTIDTIWLQRDSDADYVTNFTSGQDKIRLSGDEFDLGAMVSDREFVSWVSGHTPIGAKAQFIMDGATHELYYDRDGTGTRQPELIATFSNSSTPQWYDFEIV